MISEKAGEIIIDTVCVNSLGCPAATVCSQGAILRDETGPSEGVVMCKVCPVRCEIPPGGTGDCQMLTNKDGKIVRRVELTPCEKVKQYLKPDYEPVCGTCAVRGLLCKVYKE